VKDFDKVGLIKHAWEIVKKNSKLIALLIVAFIIYQIVQGIVQGMFVRNSIFSSIISLIFTIVTIFLQIGATKILLKLVDGQKAQITELWAYPQFLPKMILATIISIIALGIPIALLIYLAPSLGILFFVTAIITLSIFYTYLALRFQFYSYYIVDRNTSFIDSFKLSWRATDKNVINIFLFELLLVGINILGAIALVVGLLVTIPVSVIAVTLLYRKLSS